MKILHFQDTGGVSIQLRNAQRRLGHTSDVLLTWRSPLGYPVDFIDYYGPGRFKSIRPMMRSIKRARKYDIVHIHTGIAKNSMDYLGCKYLAGKPLVVHYHGTEVRDGYGLHYMNAVDAKIVATPDLLGYEQMKDAMFIPNPFDSVGWKIALPSLGTSPIKIGHYPTVPKLKGTDIILKAMEILKARGVKVEFDTINQHVPHSEIISRICCCDIVIDQVGDPEITGVPELFGMISLESMAMGKVVISNLLPKYREMYSGRKRNPIIRGSHNPDELADIIQGQIYDRELLQQIGWEGVIYVNEVHNPEQIALRIQDIYEELV